MGHNVHNLIPNISTIQRSSEAGDSDNETSIVKGTSRTDIQLALLAQRNSPINGMTQSPAQLLMNRRLRDKLPMYNKSLQPRVMSGTRQQLSDHQKQFSNINFQFYKIFYIYFLGYTPSSIKEGWNLSWTSKSVMPPKSRPDRAGYL